MELVFDAYIFIRFRYFSHEAGKSDGDHTSNVDFRIINPLKPDSGYLRP